LRAVISAATNLKTAPVAATLWGPAAIVRPFGGVISAPRTSR